MAELKGDGSGKTRQTGSGLKKNISKFKKTFFSSSSSSKDGLIDPSTTQLPSQPATPNIVYIKEHLSQAGPVTRDPTEVDNSVTAGHPTPAIDRPTDARFVAASIAHLPVPNDEQLPESPAVDQASKPSDKEFGKATQIIVPIRELWNEAYENLRSKEEALIKDYEALSFGNVAMTIPTILPSALKIRRREKMEIILKEKISEVERDSWKLKFGGKEIPVKDLVQPVASVISQANQFIGDALSANPYASIAWFGVSLLLPLLLNPSQQAVSLAKGLEVISNLIVQSSMREDLYCRQYELKSSDEDRQAFPYSHIGYRDTLKELYTRILKFQATAICYYSHNGAFRVGLDVVKWNNWDTLLADIQAQETTFWATNEVWKDTKYELECLKLDKRHKEIMECWNSIGKDLSSLHKAIDDASRDQKNTETLNWLSSIDPSQFYNSALYKHATSTGDWLVNDGSFVGWKNAPNSLFWLHGKAGSGKSVLRMLESLIKQLCCLRPIIPQSVKDLSNYKKLGHRPDMKRLEAMLSATVHGFSDVYLVIDGLDECPCDNGERKKLLDCISRIYDASVDNLHLLFTSRKETDIEASIGLLLSSPTSISIDLAVYEDRVKHDIGLYIDETLASSTYSSWTNTIKKDAKMALLKNADGMFQYVFCQFDALQKLSTPGTIRKALNGLPKGLDATYDSILKGIDINLYRQVLSLLKWLAVSYRPLRLEELAEIFISDSESPEPFDETDRLFKPDDVLKYLPNLTVSIPIMEEDNDEGCSFWEQVGTEIRLAHFSIKEYLMSDRICKSPAANFGFTESDAHLHIVDLSLSYHLYVSEMKFADHWGLEEFQLWKYAAEMWTSHLQEVPRSLWTTSVTRKVKQSLAPSSHSLFNFYLIETPEKLRFYDVAHSEWLPPPLAYAAACGFQQLVDLLLKNGADINETCPNSFYVNALYAAVHSGKKDIVQHLLANGADANVRASEHDSEFKDAVQAAVAIQHKIILEMLLNGRADINGQGGPCGNALNMAAHRGCTDIVNILLDRGADINGQGGEYGNALQAAISNGEVQVVELLLDRHADIDAQGGKYGNALQAAAKAMDMNIVQLLLDKGANVNARGGKYGNALQAAANARDMNIVQLLLDRGADINAQGGKYGNALQAAAKARDMNIVQLLLDRGADINAHGGKYGNALQAAAKARDMNIMQLLLDKGADINAHGGKYGNALQAAVSFGDEDIVQILLDRAADVNAHGGLYGSALFAAATVLGDGSILQLLLDRGADINGRGEKHENILQAAVSSCNPRYVQILLERGSDPKAINDSRKLLFGAVDSNWTEMVDMVLGLEGVDLNAKDDSGRTPLSYAVNKSGAVIKLLLAKDGIDLDSKDTKGRTPLSYAAEESVEESVRMLLATNRVDINSKDNTGRTPLSYATNYWFGSIASLLLEENGVDPDSKDNTNRSPLSWAAEYGHEKVVKLLLDNTNVDLDSKDDNGRTPLSWAAEKGRKAVVALLLDNESVDPDFRDNTGRTPLSWAAARGYWTVSQDNKAVMELLLADDNVDPNSKDSNGRTPLSRAAEVGHEAAVRLLLLKRGIKPDLKDNCGQTPLLWAAKYGHVYIVESLLNNSDVDPESKDNDGRSSLSWATEKKFKAVMELLIPKKGVL